MEFLTPRGESRRWAVLAMAMAAIFAGVLALAQERPVEAGLGGTPPEQDAFVVVSGGTVNITIEAVDDDGLDVFVSGGGFAAITAIAPVSCSFDVSGDPCEAGQPVDCDVGNPTGDPCIQYENESVDLNGEQDAYTIVVQVTLECDEGQESPPITIGEWDGAEVVQESLEFLNVTCVPPDEPGVFFITKEFDGDPEQEFAFTIDSVAAVCGVSVEGGELDTTTNAFVLADGETAIITCNDPELAEWDITVIETDPGADIATLTDIDCGETDAVEDLEAASASLTVTSGELALEGAGTCTFINTAVVDDDPETPNINVTKECVGEFTATFTVDIGGEAQPISCGGEVTFPDLEPGTYTLTETIEGGDEEGFGTTITCSDTDETVNSTTREVTVGETDVTCTIVNGIDVEDIVCPCPGQTIEIDNTNTNVIGIDNDNTNNNANDNNNENENENKNDNENNNTNTNTQDQDNKQDQDNTNNQTNNIDASPEVNIDLGH